MNSLAEKRDARARFIPLGPLRYLLRLLILALDRVLRLFYGIREISHDPQCIFRLAIRRSPQDISFEDGTEVRKGDYVWEIHFRNESIPALPSVSMRLGWAKGLLTRARISMVLLAAHIRRYNGHHPPPKALFGEWLMDPWYGPRLNRHPICRIGFEGQWVPEPTSLVGRMGRFLKDLYTVFLIWAFQPQGVSISLAARGFRRVRFWISRRALLQMYHSGENAHEIKT
jgi:hypothetical protein